jgi:8-hydroxy-5-deazaflavin:NADPH oxidoreductase
MTTAIIGVGHIGGALARDLVDGGEQVVLAAKHESHAAELAHELGESARSASVEDPIAQSDTVVFAVWLDAMKDLISRDAGVLEGKVVVDPSNPIGYDDQGRPARTLPADQSAGAQVAAMLPAGARYVKAFGTLGADSLASAARRTPARAILFYATDDDGAAVAVERLIKAAGFDPVRAGGVDEAIRLEMPGGDLHQHGGLNGRLLDDDEARAAVSGGPAAT